MSQQHPYRATIPPILDKLPRPLWSVMIPTYNCAGYLRETLASVLAQDLGPDVMQIAVVDDHSTEDDPAAVVEELGRDRIEFYQQLENVGHTRNFETCLQRSRGMLIHQLHGDDCVRDGFYQKMQQAFSEKPEIGAAFCRHIIMDDHSHWQFFSILEQPESGILPRGWLELIASFQRIQTPSIVVRREVYETLGGFDRRIGATEDWEMWVRISANYPVWYETEPLAIYRKSSKSLSSGRMKTGEFIQDMRKAIEVFQEYLPSVISNKVYKKAMQNSAFFALETSNYTINQGDRRSTINLIREALKCSRSFIVIRSACRIILLNGTLWLWRTLQAAADSRSSKFIKTTDVLKNSNF